MFPIDMMHSSDVKLVSESPIRSRGTTIPWQAIANGVLIAGVVFRVGQYLADRCFWIDECFLALNIVRSDFADLHKPLGLNQASPILFLYLQRGAIALFGPGEMSLRLVPLAASCLSLFLFRRLAALILSPPMVCFALALIACSDPLIYYATEAKQYTIDVVVCVGLLYMGVKQLHNEATWWTAAAFACVGALAIMASFPALFVLAGVGLGYWCVAPRKRFWQSAMIAATWLEAFLLCYFVFYRYTVQNSFLSDYWRGAFAPFPPCSGSDLAWYSQRFVSFLDMLGWPFYLFIIPSVLTLLGVATIWRRSLSVSLMLLVPFVVALVASICHAYPFDGRTVLYLLPPIALALAAGLDWIAGIWGNKTGTVVLVVLMLLAVAPEAWEATYRLATPRHRCEVRRLANLVRSNCRQGDLVYFTWHASVLHNYCRQIYGDVPVEALFETEGKLEDRISRPPQVHRVWVLYASSVDYNTPTHCIPDPADTMPRGGMLQQHATLVGKWRDRGATAELYEIAPSQKDAIPKSNR